MEADRLGVCEALDRGRTILILDTNFAIYMAGGLVSPSMFLDALEMRYSMVVCRQTVQELEMLSEHARQLKTRKQARRGLELLRSLGACLLECEGEDADDAILMASLALSRSGYRVVVATGDRELRRRLRRRGVPTLYYRESEGRLETDWDII